MKAPMTFPRWFERWFGLDVRSLAVVRVCLGAIVLADLAIRAGDLAVFHADSGLLPRAAWLAAYPKTFSLYAASGSPLFTGALFALQALAALGLIVGFRTRLMTFATWLLVTSLQARNPAILQAGDALLGLLLFWGMFVPLGAAFSLDAAASDPPSPRRVASLGTLGLTLQMPLVYFFTGLLKGGAEWRTSYTAIERALNDDFIASPFGTFLAHAVPTSVLRALTASVIVAELGIPILLLCPLKTDRVRAYVLPSLFLLQLTFFACFRIGLFPFISTTGALVLMPTAYWDWLGKRVSAPTFAHALRARVTALALRVGAGRASFQLGRLGSVLALCALLFVVVDNVGSLGALTLPKPVAGAGDTLRLRQSWKMFVKPNASHRWIVMEGHRDDGSRLDLLAGDGRPATYHRPDHISDTFENYRWRKYLGNVMRKGHRAVTERKALASYLCRNQEHGQLDMVVAYRFDELSSAPADARPTRKLLFRKHCGAGSTSADTRLSAAR